MGTGVRKRYVRRIKTLSRDQLPQEENYALPGLVRRTKYRLR